jgi:hypothetical protein
MDTSNENSASTAQYQSSAGPFRAWISRVIPNYVEKNFGTALWSVLLLLAGSVFVIYFAVSIRFMPELDIGSSVGLLAVSALTGGFLLIWFAFFVLYPSLTLARATSIGLHWKWVFGFWSIVILSGLLPPASQSWKWWCGIASCAFVVDSVLFWWLHKEQEKWRHFIFFIVVEACGPFVALAFLLVAVLQVRSRLDALAVALFSLVAVVFNTLLMVTPSRDAIMKDALNEEVTSSRSGVAAGQKRILWRRGLVLPIAVVLILLLGTNNLDLIPKLVMRIYKFGNFKATLILDETGCAIIRQQGFTPTADSWTGRGARVPDTKGDATPTSQTCSLPVTILCRLGGAYYLEASRSGASSARFTIPGQHVISWAVNESKEATPVSAARSTP